MADRRQQMMTPPALARLWGVSPEKVRGWIESGELCAMNVASKLGGRPRYRIDLDEVRAFVARRSATENSCTGPAPRAPPPDDQTIAFF